jgi:hypothetical protein
MGVPGRSQAIVWAMEHGFPTEQYDDETEES